MISFVSLLERPARMPCHKFVFCVNSTLASNSHRPLRSLASPSSQSFNFNTAIRINIHLFHGLQERDMHLLATTNQSYRRVEPQARRQLRNGGCGGGGGNKKTDGSLSTVVPVEHLRQLRRSNGCSREAGRRQADPRDDVVSVIKVVGAWWRSGAIVMATDGHNGILNHQKGVDLNRARAPLLEIVTEPHMGSRVEAGEYANSDLFQKMSTVSNWQIPAVVKDLVKKTEETSMENLASVPSAAHRRLTSTKGNTNQ
ncbi:hypothetical protein HID58_053018 [Brassica napus]|uniref:Aspartyl/Glutamyl-tRNA(Gln) amidotransferase subunit B/E catalytic domain-containing protein n=1 Tax=Brassica napus TaxID=3708 RepID=A0ABQ8ADI7_BRANA|nr:hypothetical protein HID58_053018 [Brassica napus]